MEDLIAKRYVKALLKREDSEEFYTNLLQIYPAFAMNKFQILLQSQEYSKEQKLALVLSFFEKMKPAFKNFLKLLSQNSRLSLIPKITEELRKQKAVKNQIYTAIIYSEQALQASKIQQLQEKLSQKFKLNIALENQISQNKGIKISLEELGYELSFSMQTLKNKLSDYILKTL